MHNREAPGNIGMGVYVLTMGFWPTYPTVSAILPAEVKIVYLFFYFFLFFVFCEILVLSITRNFYKFLFK
jgi:hypothetical protein